MFPLTTIGIAMYLNNDWFDIAVTNKYTKQQYLKRCGLRMSIEITVFGTFEG